ncbi:MAG: carbohydrate kinase family protein [Prolixibacteraceae bacterium]
MGKVYLVGETTYDIIFRNGIPTGAVVGGSILNTSVTLGRLGVPVNFISRMGNDQIGDLSLKFLEGNGVNCNLVNRYEGNSRLALAFLGDGNNAEYQFYKAEKAPSLRFPELEESDRVIFGSTNAIREEGRNNLLLFLNQAHDKNVLTIYDPNIREFGVLELIEVRRRFEENLFMTKILKGSNQDFLRLFETADADVIFDRVAVSGVETLIVTYGPDPVELRTKSLSMSIPFVPVQPVSTIGAGDNFTAGLMYGIMKEDVKTNELSELKPEVWKRIVAYATAFASEVCLSESNYISESFVEESF